MNDFTRLVIGTAGHIDHGKSRLVHALTDTDPDRLPEEKLRGMTIDLGFAHLRQQNTIISFVDVPGHERFIKNMVAGATGIDAALLVVAADDSVMPQTREHAEVLSLLGVNQCIVALTKMDLVDDEWADAVEDEVRQLLNSLEIEPLAVVRTSAENRRGCDQLRDHLVNLAQSADIHRPTYHWFRLPIDRAFNVQGRGTVVTGSVAHGRIARDDELDLWPANQRIRIRDLQSHYDAQDQSLGRTRLALNLAAISLDDVARGCELATPGYLQLARYLDVWLPLLRMPGKTIRQRLRLRLHIATSDVLAELRLPQKPTDLLTRGTFAQIRLNTPIVASWGQRFILRDESATRTLGGGLILRPVARPWTGKRPMHTAGLETLRDAKPRERLAEVIRAAEWQILSDHQLATRAGLNDADQANRLTQSLIAKQVIIRFDAGSQRLLAHYDRLNAFAEDTRRKLLRFQNQNPRAPGIPRTEWPAWMPHAADKRIRPAIAQWLIQFGHAIDANGYITPPTGGVAIPPEDQALLEQILSELHHGAFQPPAIEDLHCVNAGNRKRAHELLDLAIARRDVIRIADGIWLHAQRWHELIQRVQTAIDTHGPQTVSQIRSLLDSSRKYVVPICEKLDAEKITRRVGDRRQRA